MSGALTFEMIRASIGGRDVAVSWSPTTVRSQSHATIAGDGAERAATDGTEPTKIVDHMPVTLSAQGISYAVKTKKGVKPILSDVSFDVTSGQVMFVMGPSGAGKTTLMNILTARADKKDGPHASGSVTLNGLPMSALVKTHTAYIEQFTTSWAFLTPREVLHAATRFFCRSKTEAIQRAEKLIVSMGLSDCADVKCGNESFPGISGGQKRRLATAEALVKSPAVVFMDEPMSGLDSTAAESIMNLIHRIAAETGTIFVISVHQPSMALFLKFERVLMLTKGEIAYLGSGSGLSDYCEIAMKSPVAYGVNPCDHFLNMINPDFVGAEQALSCIEVWKSYSACQHGAIDTVLPSVNGPPGKRRVFASKSCPLKNYILGNRQKRPVEILKNKENLNAASTNCRKRDIVSLAASRNLPFPRDNATTLQRLLILMRRQALLSFRDPSLYTGRMLFYLLSNLFFAIVYIGVRRLEQDQIFPRVLLLNWFMSVPCCLAIVTVYFQGVELRLVAREVRNGMFSPATYLIATSILQIPLVMLLVAFAFLIPGYAVAKLHIDNAPAFLLTMFLTFYSFEAAAQFFAACTRNALIGMMLFLQWWFISFLFSGSLVDPEEIIWPLRGLTYIVPFAWGTKGIALAEFRDRVFSGAEIVDTSVSPLGYVCTSQIHCYGKYGPQVLNALHNYLYVVEADASIAVCCGVLVAIAAVFKLGFFVATWWRCR